MMNRKAYHVAIYMRLSREDGKEESQSIQSQRAVLRAYVEEQGWIIADEYVDDGYSGTDFERPNFKRLIEDVELGRIDLVITKDLSRLGRNYIQVGYYIEEYFPSKNIRYIALNDGYDTGKEDLDDFVPFRNVINEWYAKDISKKIRFTLENKSKNGEPRNTVFPIFGYTYNELYERIPDAETAPIVQLIYEKFIQLASTRKVANYLKTKKIRTPQYYNALKYNYNKSKILAMPEEKWINWTGQKVRDILIREEYLGVYKTAQTKSISYKNKKRRKNENSYIFENKYQALIDKGSWELAQKMLKSTKGTSVTIEENNFFGLVYCADCGRLMRFERRKSPKGKSYDYRYYCKNKQCKYSNSITKPCLESIIHREIKHLKKYICTNEAEFLQALANRKDNVRNFSTDIERNIHIASEKNREIDLFIKRLFEEKAKGFIPITTFQMMMNGYTKEKEELERRIKELKCRQDEKIKNPFEGFSTTDIFNFLKTIDEKELTSGSKLQKIIQKITIRTRLVNNNVRKRKIEIWLCFFNGEEMMKDFIEYEG